MTHVNILMVGRIVSETQTDRQLKFIIDTRIPVATLPDSSPPLALRGGSAYGPEWVMPRIFMMLLYFYGVFSLMPHIHDDAEFLYTHIIVIPQNFSLYTGYNCGCPSSSQLLKFENGCKVSLDFISKNFWILFLRFYLGP